MFALIAWSRSSVQHELNQSTANSLRYLSQQFDDDIANLQYEMQCATQSRFITHLFAYYQTMKPSERYTELNDALTYLENLSTYNRNIDRLELYSYQHDFRLGVGKAPAVTYLSRDEMRSLLAEVREGGFRLLSSLEGELTVNYMVPISSYVTDREPTFYLRVSFRRTRVLESLQSLATGWERRHGLSDLSAGKGGLRHSRRTGSRGGADEHGLYRGSWLPCHESGRPKIRGSWKTAG